MRNLTLKGIPPEGVICIGYAYHDVNSAQHVGTIEELMKVIPSHELVWKLSGIGKIQLESL